MPSWRNKPKSEKGNYHKRRTYEQGKAEIDAAHRMTFRLYGIRCLWHRWRGGAASGSRAVSVPAACFGRALPFVPPSLQAARAKQVIAGGPRRIPLATHVEWMVRRTEIKDLVSWIFG